MGVTNKQLMAMLKEMDGKLDKLAERPADPLSDFGGSPSPIIPITGKIVSPTPDDKFYITDYTSEGGKMGDRSNVIDAKFVFDNPALKKAQGEWLVDGKRIGFQAQEIGLSVEKVGIRTIAFEYGGKILDFVQVECFKREPDQCGG